VGSAAAVLSAMQLVATAGLLGLNTLLIAELSSRAPQARSLISTATAVVSVVSGLAAAGLYFVLAAVNPKYHQLLGHPLSFSVFVVGTAFTAATVLLDDACIGLLRGQLQLRRNALFAAGKLSLVPLAALMFPAQHGLGLTLTWVVATVASVWFLRPLAGVAATGPLIDLRLVRSYVALAVRHHWLNVSLQAPRLVIPVIAVALVGTDQTAAYFTAVTIVSFFAIIPFHFATVLFALEPGDEARLTHEVRFTLTVSAGVAIVGLPVLCVGASTILGLFRPEYTSAAGALAILAFTTLPTAVKYHYVAVSRVRGRLTRAAVVTTAGSLLEVAAAGLGGGLHGITGMAIGFLAACVVEATCFSPTVVSVLRGTMRNAHTHQKVMETGRS
jgi:O-antigen/teichoic acid export membrane protein